VILAVVPVAMTPITHDVRKYEKNAPRQPWSTLAYIASRLASFLIRQEYQETRLRTNTQITSQRQLHCPLW